MVLLNILGDAEATLLRNKSLSLTVYYWKIITIRQKIEMFLALNDRLGHVDIT